MRHRMKACKPHQTLASPRKPSTHRPVIQKRRCKPYQASTRILVSRWSAAVSREFSMKVPKTACSLPHRRQLASTSPSTCFAEPAPRGVSSIGGSSMRSGSRQPPLLPSRAPGGPRKGRTHDGCSVTQGCFTPSWRDSRGENNREALPGRPADAAGNLPLRGDELLSKKRILRNQFNATANEIRSQPGNEPKKIDHMLRLTPSTGGWNL